MADTPEKKIKTMITKYLKSLGLDCWYHMPIGGMFAAAGVPDYVGGYRGCLFAIEAKKPGGKPTALQVKNMKEINASGGYALVVDGPETLAMFKVWVDSFGAHQAALFP